MVVALTFVLGLVMIGVVAYSIAFIVLPRSLGVSQTDLKIGTMESLVLFQSRRGNTENYLAFIHPQGWQDTDIPINRGQVLTFKAGGKIQVDVNGLVEQTRQRALWEAALQKGPHALNPDSPESMDIPEDHFSPAQRSLLADERLYRPWTGPEGYAASIQAWKARRTRFVAPDAPLGALIGSIRPPDESRGSLFVIGDGGENRRIAAEVSGKLWVTVNDVTSDETVPGLFFRDNVGFYWLKVAVAAKE